MEFISKLKKNLGFTTVTSTADALTTEVPKAKTKIHITDMDKKIFRCILKIIKTLSRVFVGAIIFIVLANFAPELREQIPSFYKIVDFVLSCLEWISSQVCNIFGNLI